MRNLLFIHPNERLQSLYKRHLSNFFNVDSAFDGMKGLRLIKERKPHVIVSDYELPIISGYTLLNYVRKDSQLSLIPFIFLSQNHPTTESLNLGANYWMVVSESNPKELLTVCMNLSPSLNKMVNY